MMLAKVAKVASLLCVTRLAAGQDCATINAYDESEGQVEGACAGIIASGAAACNPDFFQGGQYAG